MFASFITTSQTGRTRQVQRRRRLLAILVIGLGVRLYVALTAGMISRDGATFIWYAQSLGRNLIAALREHDQHPLYPALVLGAHALLAPMRALFPDVAWVSDAVLGWQTAAMLVTLACGLAVIVAVYSLSSALFNPKIGIWAALLTALAAEFCQLSADALSDMTHLSLYVFATAEALRGFETRSANRFLLTGILSGLAFLCRPEGGEVAVATCFVLLVLPVLPKLRLPWLIDEKDVPSAWLWQTRLRCMVAVLVGAMIVAGPYMLITGRIVKKKPVDQLVAAHSLGVEHFAGESQALRWSGPAGLASVTRNLPKAVRAQLLIGEKYARSLRVTLLLPAIAFLLARRFRRTPIVRNIVVGDAERGLRWLRASRALLFSLVALHLFILIRLLYRFNYWEILSVRHVLVLAALTLPFSAAGIVLMLHRVRSARRGIVAGGMVALLVAPTLPWMLARRNVQDVYLRRAGEWIRSQEQSETGAAGGARILTTRNMVAFYAGGLQVWSPPEADAARILSEAREKRPGWLVFDEQRLLRERPAFFDQLRSLALPGEEIRQVWSASQQNRDQFDTVRVFRYRAGAGGPRS